MLNLQSLCIINQPSRITSIDFFRAIAIITVVVFHYNSFLPFGYLGVDLFFLISGFLIGNLLTQELEKKDQIKIGRFLLNRGVKIWPSYYFFLLVGNIIANLLYATSHPDQPIPLHDLPKYLFFYHNYVGGDFHWCFDHVWSLCVEEHFYLMLPILYLIARQIKPPLKRKRFFYSSVSLVIIAGIVFKFLSFHYTNSQDTYAATHNRIDALGWGVLLNFIINYSKYNFSNPSRNSLLLTAGLGILSCCIFYSMVSNDIYFQKVYLHSIVSFSFFLILLACYKISFFKLKALRFISYYSYNWYLWHPIFVIFISDAIGKNTLGLSIYLIISFSTALITTIFIEEPLVKWRKDSLKNKK